MSQYTCAAIIAKPVSYLLPAGTWSRRCCHCTESRWY